MEDFARSNARPSDFLLWEADLAGPTASHATSYQRAHSRYELGTVFVIDDNQAVRAALCDLLHDDGYVVVDFESGPHFLDSYRPTLQQCLLVDALLPGFGGIDLIEHLRAKDDPIPAIVLSGHANVAMAVRAMKVGAVDFLEKPVRREEILSCIEKALAASDEDPGFTKFLKLSADRVASLTERQHQILHLILAGHPAKNIAADLGISQRTVENHRASIAHKTDSKSMAALMRTGICGHCRLNNFAGAFQDNSRVRPAA